MVEDVFADEWRACLRAHYKHVIRTGDHVTEPSLRVVMHQAGFDDSELAELRVLATMHIDDSGADFVPDMDVLEPPPAPTAEARVFAGGVPVRVEETAFSPVDAEEYALVEADVEEASLLEEETCVEDAALDEIPPEEAATPPEEQDDEPDEPAQLSLF
jgi:hypothetical protein